MMMMPVVTVGTMHMTVIVMIMIMVAIWTMDMRRGGDSGGLGSVGHGGGLGWAWERWSGQIARLTAT
jgi:hypothetical protein